MKSHFSMNAVNLIRGLTNKEVKKRLGCNELGIEGLKKHPFFKDIDWNRLAIKEVKPPYVPKLESELDCSKIDPEFTA